MGNGSSFERMNIAMPLKMDNLPVFLKQHFIKGIPNLNGKGRGDQFVTVYVETPRNLTAEQREALKKFGETLGETNYGEERKGFFGKKRRK